MSWRRAAAAVSWLTVSSACGGGSTTDLPLRVTSPAAPTTSDWSVSGRVTTQAGVPIAGAVVSPPGLPTLLTSAAGGYTVAGLGSPAQDPYPLEITANNYLRRRVWVRWQPGARIGVDVDLISLSSPFSLKFYRELARDAQETPGALKPLELWPGGNPNVYVRTVDQNGDAIAQEVLDGVYDTIPGAVSDWTNGKLSVATLEHGPAARQRQDGWIIVTFVRQQSGGDICGQSYIGELAGMIQFVDGACTCGSNSVPRQVVAHEVGHAMGFFHVSDPGSLMYPQASGNCANVTPSAAERFHSAIAWSRVPGNTDPDLDPSGLTPLSRRDILVIN
jgi:hypothetical protein